LKITIIFDTFFANLVLQLFLLLFCNYENTNFLPVQIQIQKSDIFKTKTQKVKNPEMKKFLIALVKIEKGVSVNFIIIYFCVKLIHSPMATFKRNSFLLNLKQIKRCRTQLKFQQFFCRHRARFLCRPYQRQRDI